MLWTILILFALAIGGLLAYASTKPDEFRTERSALMMAPPSFIFHEVNDFHKWYTWSPWAKLDPNCKNTFEGPESGEGSSFAWDGDRNVGAGKMTILESRPDEYIRLRLDFYKPMKGTSILEFTFKPENARQTLVTWRMHGPSNLLGKLVSVFINCEKMTGDMYEKGLANLKDHLEKNSG